MFSSKTISSNDTIFASPLRNDRGMTLIEIMIVIAIIAGLMAVLGGNVMSALEKSKVSNTKISMKQVQKALDQYNLACGTYPTTDQGLGALLKDPGKDVCQNWGEPYLKEKELKDAWNRVMQYESDGAKMTLRSLGKDGKEGGESYNADINLEDI